MPPVRLMACLAALLLAGCSGPPDAPTAAHTFLDQIIDGKTDEAYRSASFPFQALASENTFTVQAREMGLIDGRLAEFAAGEQDAKIARFQVTIVTPGGDPVPLVLTMQQERGAWRAFSLKSTRDPRTGRIVNHFSAMGKSMAFEEGGNLPLPDEKEARRFVRDAMNDFAQAVSQRDFNDFYGHVSAAWRAQISEKQLEHAFKGFLDQEINLTGVVNETPIFDTPPVISTDGLLLIDGHYPTTPYEVLFSFKFVFEDAEWKLYGVDVNLRQAAAATGKGEKK